MELELPLVPPELEPEPVVPDDPIEPPLPEEPVEPEVPEEPEEPMPDDPEDPLVEGLVVEDEVPEEPEAPDDVVASSPFLQPPRASAAASAMPTATAGLILDVFICQFLFQDKSRPVASQTSIYRRGRIDP
jgi:outer membrane biosynthesis protein TonB